MAYSSSYVAGDTSKAAIDIIVGVLSVLVSFATLIGLVLVYKYMQKRA